MDKRSAVNVFTIITQLWHTWYLPYEAAKVSNFPIFTLNISFSEKIFWEESRKSLRLIIEVQRRSRTSWGHHVIQVSKTVLWNYWKSLILLVSLKIGTDFIIAI